MGLSRRKYAEYRGVSESAVRKAIASGRITTMDDGTINPATADLEWDAQTDPAKQRGKHAQAAGKRSSASTARAQAALRPVPKAALDSVNDTLREAGETPLAGPDAPAADAGEVSYAKAKMANEVIKAQTAKVRLQKMKGELVDRTRATAMVYDQARQLRDSFMGWPPRVAANMAAELGVEAHTVEAVLDKYLREHLAQMAQVKLDLR